MQTMRMTSGDLRLSGGSAKGGGQQLPQHGGGLRPRHLPHQHREHLQCRVPALQLPRYVRSPHLPLSRPSGLNKNNSSITLCSKCSAFLKPFSVNICIIKWNPIHYLPLCLCLCLSLPSCLLLREGRRKRRGEGMNFQGGKTAIRLMWQKIRKNEW